MSHNATPNTSRVELRKTLTLVPVVMMGLAYMQPMTLFDTFGIVSGMTDGHVPTAYAFALIAILFTALSYGKLVRRYPSAVRFTASIIVQLYEYTRTIFTITAIGQLATARVAQEKEFGYSSRQPPIRVAVRVNSTTADTGIL